MLFYFVGSLQKNIEKRTPITPHKFNHNSKPTPGSGGSSINIDLDAPSVSFSSTTKSSSEMNNHHNPIRLITTKDQSFENLAESISSRSSKNSNVSSFGTHRTQSTNLSTDCSSPSRTKGHPGHSKNSFLDNNKKSSILFDTSNSSDPSVVHPLLSAQNNSKVPQMYKQSTSGSTGSGVPSFETKKILVQSMGGENYETKLSY